jgi:hypothetical protein
VTIAMTNIKLTIVVAKGSNRYRELFIIILLLGRSLDGDGSLDRWRRTPNNNGSKGNYEYGGECPGMDLTVQCTCTRSTTPHSSTTVSVELLIALASKSSDGEVLRNSAAQICKAATDGARAFGLVQHQ